MLAVFEVVSGLSPLRVLIVDEIPFPDDQPRLEAIVPPRRLPDDLD
jgi:hypothetical protein